MTEASDTLEFNDNERTAAAEAVVRALSSALTRLGYTFHAISIAKFVDDGKRESAPGASVLSIDPRMGPALPQYAELTRRMANEIDAAFAATGMREATVGYTYEVERTKGERS